MLLGVDLDTEGIGLFSLTASRLALDNRTAQSMQSLKTHIKAHIFTLAVNFS